MSWVVMSERNVRRIEVLSEVVAGRRTIGSAASVLSMTSRHVHRLLDRLRSGGGMALVHKGRGRASNRRIGNEVHNSSQAKGRGRGFPQLGPIWHMTYVPEGPAEAAAPAATPTEPPQL